jgi:predicted PurR-regulated permease PerM
MSARVKPPKTVAAPAQTSKPAIPAPPPTITPVAATDSPPWSVTTKAIVASAALVLLALVVWRFDFLIAPITLAAVFAYLLNPPIRWLQHKTKIGRATSVLIVYAVLLLVLGGLGVAAGLALAEQGVRLWTALPDFLPRLVEQVQSRVQALGGVTWSFGPYRVDLSALVALINWSEISVELRSAVQSLLGRGGPWLAGLASATLSRLSEALLVLVMSIYLAMDAPRIGAAISEAAHQPGYRHDADRLMAETVEIWNTYLRGQVVLGLVMGIIVGIVLGLMGVNNAFELGLLAGLLEFLPVLGPVISAGVAVLVALFQSGNAWGMSPWMYAGAVLVVMIILQQLENAVLVPRIVGDALDLHPLVVMVGVLMGASLGGLLGAVLAAPVLASLKLYGIYVWRKMLGLPPFVERPPQKPEQRQMGFLGQVWSMLPMPNRKSVEGEKG